MIQTLVVCFLAPRSKEHVHPIVISGWIGRNFSEVTEIRERISRLFQQFSCDGILKVLIIVIHASARDFKAHVIYGMAILPDHNYSFLLCNGQRRHPCWKLIHIVWIDDFAIGRFTPVFPDGEP